MSGPDFSAPGGWPGPPPHRSVPPPGYSTGFAPFPPAAPIPAGPFPLGATSPGPIPLGPAGADRPRPVAIPLTVCLTVTAALLWMSALASGWMMALLGQQSLSESPADLDSRTVLLINHFTARLADGLAWPLFGLPLVATVLAFLVVMRRGWPRILYTVWGALSLGWLFWWVGDNPLVVVAPGLYIAIAVGLVWLPSVTQWLARRDAAGGLVSDAVGRAGPR